MVFTLLALLGIPVQLVYHKFLSLAVTSIVFSFILALFLYCKSMHADHTSLADGGTSGEDFYGTLIMYCYYYCIFSVFFNNHVVYTLSIGLLYKLLIVIINLNKFRVVQKIPHKVYSTVTLQP